MASWIVRASLLAATALTATGCGGILGIEYLANDLDAGTDATNAPDSGAMDGGSGRDAMPSDALLSFDQASADVRDERGSGAQDSSAASDVGADGRGPADSAVEAGPADAAIDGRADASVCSAPCPVGQSRCGTGVVETCQLQANGCAAWITTATCGPHQACSATGTTASCACDATMCTQRGTVCQDAQTKATCAQDANGCLYVASTTTCSPMICAGLAPTAACALACADSCTTGQTSCVSGGLATCVLGSNGCWAYGPPTCTGAHQTCTGSPGAAICGCKADPVCARAGTACASASTLTTCAQDPQGCFYQTASGACMGGMTCQSGMCGCSGTTPNLCGTACTDLVSDPSNCGACGRSCLSGASATGQCAGSICQPFVLQNIGPLTPPLLVDPNTVPLLGNAATLYATLSGNGAASINAQTGSVLQSPTGIFTPSNVGGGLFSENPTTLYGLDNSTGTARIVGVTKSSMTAFSVPYSQPAGSDLWLGVVGGSPEQICVYVGGDNSVQCGGGGQAANLVVCTNGPDSLCQGPNQFAADTLGLVWVSETFQGQPNVSLLLAQPNLVSPTTVALPGNTRPGPIVLDASYAYWFDSNGSGIFYKTLRAPSGTTTQISSAPIAHAPQQLAIDSKYLYWTDTAVGTVSRVAIAAGAPTAPTTIATNQVGPTGIAVDGNAIYWINSSGNALMKMAKPQ